MLDSNGKIAKIPIFDDTGYLNTHLTSKKNIERISKQTSMYFKVLKSLAIVFSVISIFSASLIACFNWGVFSDNSLKDNSVKNTLGNLGSSSLQCAQSNLYFKNELSLHCPKGTVMHHMHKFGL